MSEEREKDRWTGATVRLRESERLALEAAARDRGSISEVMRDALKLYLTTAARPERRYKRWTTTNQ